MNACPACSELTPFFLMCDCPEATCTDCHHRLEHPGSPCPECPGSHGYLITGQTPSGPLTAECPRCSGTGRLS